MKSGQDNFFGREGCRHGRFQGMASVFGGGVVRKDLPRPLRIVLAVNLILCSQIKNWIGGPAGNIISCFVQMFYVAVPLSIMPEIYREAGPKQTESGGILI